MGIWTIEENNFSRTDGSIKVSISELGTTTVQVGGQEHVVTHTVASFDLVQVWTPSNVARILFSLVNGASESYGSAITFRFRHQHAVTNSSRILFSDVLQVALLSVDYMQILPFLTSKIPRPSSFEARNSARKNWKPGLTPALDWDHWDPPLGIQGPHLCFRR